MTMSVPWNQMKRLLALAVVGAVVAAYVKRPVRQPAPTGVWGPADHKRSDR